MPLLNGTARIFAERGRQLHEKSFDAAHDDRLTDAELARAAVFYAILAVGPEQRDNAEQWWPWNPVPNPGNGSIDEKVSLLERAGALCAAEIDRLLRKKARKADEAERVRT